MPRHYRPHIPQNPSELLDLLALMLTKSPTFLDTTG
jgi:hypothetical protein